MEKTERELGKTLSAFLIASPYAVLISGADLN